MPPASSVCGDQKYRPFLETWGFWINGLRADNKNCFVLKELPMPWLITWYHERDHQATDTDKWKEKKKAYGSYSFLGRGPQTKSESPFIPVHKDLWPQSTFEPLVSIFWKQERVA